MYRLQRELKVVPFLAMLSVLNGDDPLRTDCVSQAAWLVALLRRLEAGLWGSELAPLGAAPGDSELNPRLRTPGGPAAPGDSELDPRIAAIPAPGGPAALERLREGRARCGLSESVVFSLRSTGAASRAASPRMRSEPLRCNARPD